MTTEVKAMGHHELDLATYRQKLVNNRLGLWLFLISDFFMFGGLLVSRFVLWGDTRPHLDQRLGLIVTAILLVSSFFMNRAETAMVFGDRKAFLRYSLVTFILGTVFLIGMVGVEWQTAPFSAADNVYGAIFYMMTGMHAFHVLTGLIFLGIVINNVRRGLYSTERHWAVEAATIYWHFIDVVWLFFFPALYLIGRLIG